MTGRVGRTSHTPALPAIHMRKGLRQTENETESAKEVNMRKLVAATAALAVCGMVGSAPAWAEGRRAALYEELRDLPRRWGQG